MALHLFEYIKNPNYRIVFDYRDIDFYHILDNKSKLRPNFLAEYPDAVEETGRGFPRAYGHLLQSTIFCNSNHTDNKRTMESITGIITYVGLTPVLWISRNQGSNTSSKYTAEFTALCTTTEEAILLRYMLHCFGVSIPSDSTGPIRFLENLSIIQNAHNRSAKLSKKHVAISFHSVCEGIAAGITTPFWIKVKLN